MNNKNKQKSFSQKVYQNIFVCILCILFLLFIVGIPLLLNYFEILHFSAANQFLSAAGQLYAHKVEFIRTRVTPSCFLKAIFTIWFVVCWYHILIRLFYMLVFKLTGYNHTFMYRSMIGLTAQDYVYVLTTKGLKETWPQFLFLRLFVFICFLLGRFVVIFVCLSLFFGKVVF